MAINLLPKPSEMANFGAMVTEGHTAFGVKAWLTNPLEVKVPEVGYAAQVTYDEEHKYPISVIFDPHPNPKLLQRLGWEIDHNTSLLVTIPRYLPKSIVDTSYVGDERVEILPERYSVITLDSDYYDYGREFWITEVTEPMFNPVFYYAKIGPHTLNGSRDGTGDVTQDATGTDNNINRFVGVQEINPEYITPGGDFRFIQGLTPRSSDRNGVL